MQLDRQFFRFLLRQHEAGATEHTYSELKMFFPNQSIAELCEEAFQDAGFAEYIAVDGLDDIREIEELEPGQFVYFDLGYVPVPARDITLYRYQPEWLPKTLRQGLHLSGEQKSIIPERLWFLGYFRCFDSNEPVWLARGLCHGIHFDAIYDALLSSPGGQTGIVLSHTQPVSKRASLPGNYHIIDPYDLLNEQGYLCGEKLYQYLNPHKTREDTLMHWDEHRGFFYRKDLESPIEFRGRKQKAVVSLLYECSLKKDNKWNMHALLEEVGSASPHITKLFSGHPDWEKVIAFDDSTCWIRLPTH